MAFQFDVVTPEEPVDDLDIADEIDRQFGLS